MTCRSCGAENAAGSRFCNGCGTSLLGHCPSCGAENTPAARFCAQCGAKLGDAAATPAAAPAPVDTSLPYAERRQLTVLFSDLVGSTALSEQIDPEDLRAILRDYQAVCSAAINRYDGYLAKYLGDGILAYFGYPTAHEDDAQRAVHSGMAIIEEVGALGAKYRRTTGGDLDVRVGIHTGLVVVGDMDRGDALESNAIVGQTPNMAARIQSLADHNALLVSGDTYRLIQGFFECRDLGHNELKGISQPVRIYRVLGESGARSRLDAIAAGLTPLAGRDEESAALRSRWARALEGDGQIILIGGEAGVGKSRLVFEVKEIVAENHDVELTELRCSQFHQNSALYPVSDVLERTLGFEREDTPEERERRVVEFVAARGLDTVEIVPLVAALLSVPHSADYPPPVLTPQRQKEKTIEAVIALLVAGAKDHPVVAILEDLHWADPSTLELLDTLFERCCDHNLMLVLTYRPAFTPYWPSQSNMARIDLSGLPRGDAEEIIRRTAGKPLPDEAVSYILTKTDGIPLFLEEMTKTLVESEFLRETDDGYELAAPLTSLGVPSTLQDSLTARLDRLSDAKPMAQLGAAVGREFSYEMVEAIPGPHRRNLPDALGRLVDAGILFQKGAPPHATYVFKHALIQDTAYSSLLKSSRSDYHKLIAEAIENHYPEMTETQPEVLAHHYSHAGAAEKGIGYWLKAGMRALQRSANVESIAHLERGLEMIEALPDPATRLATELQLLTMKGPALLATRGFAAEEVGSTFGRAAEICEKLGGTPQLFPSLWGQWVYNLVRDELETADALAEQMMAMGEATGDAGMMLEASWTLGNAQFWMGDLESAQRNLERAVALYDPAVHHIHAYYYGQDPGVAARCYLVYTLLQRGEIEEMKRVEREMLALAESLHHPFTTGWSLCFSMMLTAWRFDHAAALPMADRAIAFCTEQSYPFWLFAAIVVRGWALVHAGEVEEGLATIDQGLGGWNMIGSIICTATFLGFKGDALNVAGRPAEGLDAVDQGIALAQKHHERSSELDLHRLRGELLQSLGRTADAEEAMRHGLAMARADGARTRELQAATSLARLLVERGETGEVSDLLVDVVASFNEECGILAYEEAVEIIQNSK